MEEVRNQIIEKEDNVTDVVLEKVQGFAQTGKLVIPNDYSAENALKAAWLALQTVEDRDGNKALVKCTRASIANSLLDMVVQGLSPAKKQCYFIPYGKELTLSRSYMGTVAVAKRFSDVTDVHAQVVYEGDEFEYEIDPMTSNIRILKHRQNIDNIDINKIKAVYAVVQRENADPHVEIMTMAQVRKAWGQGATKGNSPAHKNFAEEMAKKTVINRACKLFVNTSSDSAILVDSFNRTTENDYRRFEEEKNIIDVADEDIRKAEDTAHEAVFGSQAVEKVGAEEMVACDEKEAKTSSEAEIATPFDEPYAQGDSFDESEQVAIGDEINE